MKIPHPVSPWVKSHRLAGIQTSGAPTGKIEITPATTPSSTGCGTPATARPIVVSTPCATAVPTSPQTTPRVTSALSRSMRAPMPPPSRASSASARAAMAGPSR